MEKVFFLTACSKLDPDVLVEVRDALIEFDPDLSRARRFLVPALNLQNRRLAGGEKLIRRSWWQAVSSKDFYIWDDLGDAKRDFKPSWAASFEAAATVLCFFAFAEVQEPAISDFQDEAIGFIRFLRSRTRIHGVERKVPDRIEITDAKNRSALSELIRPFFEGNDAGREGKSARPAEFDPEPAVYSFSLRALAGFQKFLTIDRSRIVGFETGRFTIGPSFLISLLIRAQPAVGVPVSMRIRLDGELLRESDELLISSDKDGFFDYQDSLMNLRLERPGWLEFVPFFDGKALPSHWQPVKQAYAGAFSSLKELRDQL